MKLDDRSFHVLSCDISSRPRNAAGIEELLPFVRAVTHDTNRVIVDFVPDGQAASDSFLAAERLCCTGLTWELAQSQNQLQQVVAGTPEQLLLIKQWFEPA